MSGDPSANIELERGNQYSRTSCKFRKFILSSRPKLICFKDRLKGFWRGESPPAYFTRIQRWVSGDEIPKANAAEAKTSVIEKELVDFANPEAAANITARQPSILNEAKETLGENGAIVKQETNFAKPLSTQDMRKNHEAISLLSDSEEDEGVTFPTNLAATQARFTAHSIYTKSKSPVIKSETTHPHATIPGLPAPHTTVSVNSEQSPFKRVKLEPGFQARESSQLATRERLKLIT
jgi:hypothetical protein